MLTISFVSEYRLWKACLTTVWHSFQANTCSKKSSARLLQKDVVAVLLTSFRESFWIYQLSAALKLKQREKNVVLVLSPLRPYQIWLSWGNERSWRFSHSITLPLNHAWGNADILFKNRRLSSPCSLYWKLLLIIEHSAQVLLTLLLQSEQTLLDWSFSTFVL